jgi:hypothetical protein
MEIIFATFHKGALTVGLLVACYCLNIHVEPMLFYDVFRAYVVIMLLLKLTCGTQAGL